MNRREGFRLGNSHRSLSGFCFSGFPGSSALKEFDHFGYRAPGLRNSFKKGFEASSTHPDRRRFHENLFRRTYRSLAHEIGA